MSHALSDLPDHLLERLRFAMGRTVRPDGLYVLYWMHSAMRLHENPALDTAFAAAEILDLPVLIYHALSESYPFASDRHHAFVLEGARDLQRECHQRGVAYAFHLARPGHRGRHLYALAERAALVVTEDMPVAPVRQWTARVAESVASPVTLVDTACVVPMRLAGKAFDRAFAYRRATSRLREARIELEWPVVSPNRKDLNFDLPFEPVELQAANLAALVAECEIDHTVGPVPHTKGGSSAGYARWEAFRHDKLSHYAADRNDPLRDGVSRMSAYLHYGQVSPFRLAREAAAVPGKGPEKYLDELLVWRELAYTYCFYRHDHESVTTLPGWARETLEACQRDPRPALPSWETLARAKTGDPLWDAAQRSLLIHGELHNNVRMTWGKAVLSWTSDAGRALELLIDLNHRYALDGRDPSSYGGLLWCLGQFDRPFTPERPILGTVRPRPTSQHARRLDVDRYAERTSQPAMDEPPRIAVVGAGVSGLACARTLSDHGLEPVVFDKGLRPGGRLATRAHGSWAYDHGAQYFTVRDSRFRQRVESWLADGVVAEWEGRLVALDGGERSPSSGSTRRYVGVPEMNSVAAHLAADCNLRCKVLVQGITRQDGLWFVQQELEREGPFDAVVLAVPAPQAMPLLGSAPRLRERVAKVRMRGCWAVLAGFDRPVDADFDGAFINAGPLSWVARDGSKPGRRGESWVLHASPGWTAQNLESDPGQVAERLLEAFADAAGLTLPQPVDLHAHRWRYAIPERELPEPCLFDGELRIAVCGDWCGGPRVEGAFLSGSAAAGRMLGQEAST